MKKIEEIEVGDIVWSHNSENGEKELKEVKELFRFNKNSTITLKINGEEIVTTDLHLFYTLEKSWTSAKDLELGDTVVTLSGEKYKIEAIDKDYYDGIIVVYNFEVEDNHNYYVGDNQVLVHNDGGCTVSDKGSSGDGVNGTGEARGYRPQPGERSMTKAEWKEQYRQQRLDLQASSDELSKLPQLQNKLKVNIEKMLTGRGYSSVPANSGGEIWTKAMPDSNTMSVRLDPAMVRARPRGFADEVPHAHKEIVPTTDVTSGNYAPNAAIKYNDMGLPSTGPIDAHIPIRLR